MSFESWPPVWLSRTPLLYTVCYIEYSLEIRADTCWYISDTRGMLHCYIIMRRIFVLLTSVAWPNARTWTSACPLNVQWVAEHTTCQTLQLGYNSRRPHWGQPRTGMWGNNKHNLTETGQMKMAKHSTLNCPVFTLSEWCCYIALLLTAVCLSDLV